jgi:opine dehydrogenase
LVQAISREILVGGTLQSGRTIETLGLGKLSKEEIMDFVRTGTPKVSVKGESSK